MRAYGHASSYNPRTSVVRVRINPVQQSSRIATQKYETTWLVNTDFTTRPIKLLVDTGAQVTLIDENLLKDDIILTDKSIHLTGFDGVASQTTTKGMYIGRFVTDDMSEWPAEIHVVDKKAKGVYDGYLGHGFLHFYNAIIDLGAGILKLQILSQSPEEEMDVTTNSDQIRNSEQQQVDNFDSNSDAMTDQDEEDRWIGHSQNEMLHTGNNSPITSPISNNFTGPCPPAPDYLSRNSIFACTEKAPLKKNVHEHFSMPFEIESKVHESIEMKNINRLVTEINQNTFLDSDDKITRLQKN